MKKLLLLALSISVLNYCCSKKDTDMAPAPPLKEYPIDLNFTINDSCSINDVYYDDYREDYLDSRHFYLSAFSTSYLFNDTSGLFINVDQSYFYSNDKYSIPTFEVYEVDQNGTHQNLLIMQADPPGFNFFTLPYQNDSASFSGTCYINSGLGRYANIQRKTVPLNFSGFIDTVRSKGSIRIKGSIYL